MGKIKIFWTNKAKSQLKQIHDYLKCEKKSSRRAAKVKADILSASKDLIFTGQYQKDEINPRYRRIIVRHYKLIYKKENGKIIILRVFSTYQDPNRLLENPE